MLGLCPVSAHAAAGRQHTEPTHPCVFWCQSSRMRLEVWMTTRSPSAYSRSIIFLNREGVRKHWWHFQKLLHLANANVELKGFFKLLYYPTFNVYNPPFFYTLPKSAQVLGRKLPPQMLRVLGGPWTSALSPPHGQSWHFRHLPSRLAPCYLFGIICSCQRQ